MNFMSPGNVVWFEFATADPQAIQGFYGPLLGWSFEKDPDSSIDGNIYIRIMAPGMPWPMGAITSREGGAGVGEASNLSILSTDVAADVERLRALGASVEVPATQVSDVTVFARLRDPQGNVFSLFSQSTAARFEDRMEASHEQMEQVAFEPRPGAFAWFEIGTTDPEATRDFYARAFGWRFEGEGPYQSILTGGPYPVGGLYDHSGRAGGGADYAMPCFLADDVTARVEKAVAAGARAEQGPETSPDGCHFARLLDPRGNRFGLFSTSAKSQDD
ncbi:MULTISPECIES: VOC family protein [unclassified Streptomyces]|uniref:VOC family protein n=1 Tax=unclassified Streptomyces TaxID=2593676 RepID=UPI00037C8024|nr:MULTISPECIES: VOC family protein [unclassified Streptomyces]MYT32938.1 VOC family protein [Streptomyces sp. SID8354]